MSLPKIFGIAAVVFGTVYGLAGVPNNNRVKSGDYDADAARILGVKLLVERTFEVKERVRDGSGALEQYLAQFIVITSTSDEVTVKKIVLNRGNCNGRVSDAVTYLGYTNEPIKAPSDYKTEYDIKMWRKMYTQTPPISLKFGEQARIEPECKKVIEVSITTSDDQVRRYTFD